MTPLESGTRASLRGLHVVSARVAFVTGSGGTVLRTTDGGRTFEARSVPDAGNLDFRSVVARDSTSVLVASAGTPARVYRSFDGGERFEVVHEDAHPDAFFDSLAIGTGDAIWLFGDPRAGGHLVLREGRAFGDSFTEHGHRLPQPREGEAGFAASNGCITVDAEGRPAVVTSGVTAPPRFLRLGGNAGEVIVCELPLAHGAPGRGAFAVAEDESAIVVVGGDYLAPTDIEGVGAFSHDGGRTFEPARGLRGYRSGVSAVPGRPGTFVAIGPTGGEISTDGGRTFFPVEGLSGHAIDMALGGIGFASGSEGRILRVVLP
ncbi:MAG: hypothetical protein KDC95_23120 [Planctomycetes bacterium]|nr:hypothetical protein [Planctomycetota bacterium]